MRSSSTSRAAEASAAAPAAELTAIARRIALPGVALTDGSVEALKWVGLVAMTLDHINKYLLQAAVPALFDVGRVAMPLFAIVLAWNLARRNALEPRSYRRLTARLAIAGLLATLPFMALGGLGWGWWPLNIMLTFLVAAGVIHLADRRRRAAATALFLVGGLFVEFWWPALAITVGAWRYFRRRSVWALALCLVGLAALYGVNRNFWAFMALPLVLLASRVDVPVSRLRWLFYAFYPLHLAAIWLLRTTGILTV